jgi:hypothetical protein
MLVDEANFRREAVVVDVLCEIAANVAWKRTVSGGGGVVMVVVVVVRGSGAKAEG